MVFFSHCFLKDKNGNFIVNGVGNINELNDNYRVKNSYKFKSTSKGEIILSKILNPSIYDFIINYDGNSVFTGSTKHVSVKVNKLSTKLSSGIECTVEDNLKFTLKHGNTVLANKPLDVTINGGLYRLITNNEGEIEIELKNAIKHNIKVNFNGDAIYNYTTLYHTVDVQKKNITITQMTTKITYKNGDLVKVKVGKPKIKVKLKLGDKTYTKTSDGNGIASFKIGKKPKTYKTTCSIDDSNYKGTNTSSLEIQILKITDTYNPDNFKLKRDKNLVLKLMNKNKKGISGIKVKYKFSGHDAKYKTTNDEGKITFKTSTLKVGKYTFYIKVSTKKYKFNNNGKQKTITIN